MLMAKAKEAVLEANKALAPDAASISATTDAWGSAVDTMMDNWMVQDIRENLDMIIGGCSICYMLAGEVNMEHESGGLCPTVPLDESNKVWEGFRKSLRLPGGIVCFKCLLPSVSLCEVFRVPCANFVSRTAKPTVLADLFTTAPCARNRTSLGP